MNKEERIKEFLTDYYCNNKSIQKTAEYLNIEVELVAEMRAETMKDTEEGRRIFETAIDILKRDYKELGN